MPEQLAEKLISWASILEDQTRDQAIRSSTMPFIFPHIALMPDAHWGRGATVGTVLPTLGAIIPAAVGVDIGCGMMAIRTQWTEADFDNMEYKQSIHDSIKEAISMSFGKGSYNNQVARTAAPRIQMLEEKQGVAQANAGSPNWRLQLGSLGGGNHFIEISVDEESRIWAFLHSGSRGVGNKLAQKHIKVAQVQCEKRWISLPDPDLAYLVEGEPEFWSYMEALRWAQLFAYLNREEMMERVLDVLDEAMGDTPDTSEVVNCHHNYTEQERHFGKTVWLSRKGAIDASEGKMGLIPGSMGTRSYVVRGKGDRVSLNSSPHGAGREFGRNQARKNFTRELLDKRMEGIIWGQSNDFIDEIPDAYKSIDIVMKDAEPLVDVVHELRQIINVKGA